MSNLAFSPAKMKENVEPKKTTKTLTPAQKRKTVKILTLNLEDTEEKPQKVSPLKESKF